MSFLMVLWKGHSEPRARTPLELLHQEIIFSVTDHPDEWQSVDHSYPRNKGWERRKVFISDAGSSYYQRIYIDGVEFSNEFSRKQRKQLFRVMKSIKTYIALKKIRETKG